MTESLATYNVVLVTPDGEFSFPCRSDQYILESAVGHGLDLPYMCLQGWCTTCAARILEGRLDESEARRVFPEDQEAGFALICSAYPRSDLKLRTHQKESLRAFRLAHNRPAPKG
jgi:ferredoxin